MNVIKKLTAIAAAFVLLSAAGCNSEKTPETTTLPEQQSTAAASEVQTTQAETELATTASSTTELVTEEATSELTTEAPETTTEKITTTKAPETTKEPETTKVPDKPTTTNAPSTTKKQVVAPTSKSEIVKLYNSATAQAASSKPGYVKATKTTLTSLEMGMLSKIDAVRDTIGDFLGEGESSSTVKKGKFDGKALVKSTLKESDVTGATCKLSSDKKYYIVTITVKNETNPLKSNSALGRFTKDYKDVDEIREGLSEVGASVGTITIKTSGVTINAKISVENNRFVSLSHNIKMNATLNNVKYSFAKVNKATAALETSVDYTNFKY